MNYELKFASTKGDFTLSVDCLAVLQKSRIPLSLYVAQESIITTTDEAAVKHLSEVLLNCPLSYAKETSLALLVQANDSRWSIYGRMDASDEGVSDEDSDGDRKNGRGRGLLRVVARKLSELSLVGYIRPELKDGESAFLFKKVRSALDDHQVKDRKRRRLSPVVPRSEAPSALPRRQKSFSLPNATDNDEYPSTTGQQIEKSSSRTVAPKTLVEQQPDTMKAIGTETLKVVVLDKSFKDRLKKMIVTLLSVQGISKRDQSFKDLYQHTLQAATFALRHVSPQDPGEWEAQAMTINQNLLRIFLGAEYKAV